MYTLGVYLSYPAMYTLWYTQGRLHTLRYTLGRLHTLRYTLCIPGMYTLWYTLCIPGMYTLWYTRLWENKEGLSPVILRLWENKEGLSLFYTGFGRIWEVYTLFLYPGLGEYGRF